MAKISNTTTYPTKAAPVSADYVIGTDASSKETKTFTLQSIANLYGGSGSGTVTSIGLDGGTTGLTITSDTVNPITTTGTFTLGGTLAVTNGGTGLSALGSRSKVMAVNDSATALEFVDPKVIETIEANEAISKGDPLYIVSWNNGTSTAVVGKADASDPAKMPCVGLAQSNVEINATGSMMVVGVLDQIDVNAIPSSGPNPLVNDIIYVASGGGLTSIKPQGTNLIQNIAIVLNASAQGTLQITAIGRSNDLPNISQGSIWLGDANGVPSALGIGANTYVLTSNGTTASWAAATGGSGVSLGFSPLSIYQANELSAASYTYYTMLVCDVDFTLSYIKVFVNTGTSPIYAALYSTTTGDMQTSSFTRLASFTKLTGVANGINEILIDDTPVSLTAGQNLMLAFSTANTMLAATAYGSNLVSVEETSLTTSFPTSIPDIENTTVSRKRVSIHFYAS